MHHVAVDTDILRQDPQRRSAASRRLRQLLNEGHVRLHIPDLVRREFLTAVTSDYRADLKIAEEALRRIRGDFLTSVAPNVILALRELRTAVVDKWHQDFDGWCRSQNVTIHATPPKSLAKVIDAYFEGSLPFRKAKSRADFPDALICATVEDMLRDFGELYFITRDAKLREAVAGTTIKCFASVDAFLVATYQDLSDRNDDRIFELLFANVRLLEGEAERRLRRYLRGIAIESEKLSDNEGEVSSVDKVEVFVQLPAAEKLGGGYLRFPFAATAWVTIEQGSGSWILYGYDAEDDEDNDEEPETVPGTIGVTGVLEVQVPLSASPDRYVENEQLRRAMYLAEYDLLDLQTDRVDIE